MSTPLDLAVDIAGALMTHRSATEPLNVTAIAAELSGRHAGTGFSTDDIASALAEEGASVGMAIKVRAPVFR